MNNRVVSTIRSDSSEIFHLLAKTHWTEMHPFNVMTPQDLGKTVIAIMPGQDQARPKRARIALDRLFAANADFSIETRGIDSVESVAEYQFWGLSDWIAGNVGADNSKQHFFGKKWEEYLEAQDEVNDLGCGLTDELADNVFCLFATASSHGVNIDSYLNESMNPALPGYAQRSTKKPMRLGQIDDYVARYDNLPLRLAMSSDGMREFFNNIPRAYFDVNAGMQQATRQEQIRLYRTILSCSHGMLQRAELALADDEYYSDTECREVYSHAAKDIADAAAISLVLTSYIAQASGTSLKETLNRNVAKINARVNCGRPASTRPK